MTSASIAVWFRADLRLTDNPALHHAIAHLTSFRQAHPQAPLIALYVLTPADYTSWSYAPCKIDLLLRSLSNLSSALWALKIPLFVKTASKVSRNAKGDENDPVGVVLDFCRSHNVQNLVYNALYEVDEVARDARIKRNNNIMLTCKLDIQISFVS